VSPSRRRPFIARGTMVWFTLQDRAVRGGALRDGRQQCRECEAPSEHRCVPCDEWRSDGQMTDFHPQLTRIGIGMRDRLPDWRWGLLGFVVDWCWAAQWDVVWQVRVQRCSDGASHSRRLFAGGRLLAVRYEMERNGTGVSIGRGSRPSVGLRVRQSLQDWSVGRRVPREATCGGCPGLG
jgi:hypothetical protein